MTWDQGFGIHQVDVATGTETPIVTPRRQVLLAQVVWAPDGRAIFYNRADLRTQTTEVVKRDLETGREVVLHRTTGPEGIGDGLAISPDGHHLAYLYGWRPYNGRPRSLQVIPTSGGEPREVFAVERPEWITNHVVAWTPDGQYLLFGRDGPPDQEHEMPRTELWRVPAAGGEAQRTGLVMDGAISELRIHPDGRRIAFTLRQEMDELWVIENFLPTRQAKARH